MEAVDMEYNDVKKLYPENGFQNIADAIRSQINMGYISYQVDYTSTPYTLIETSEFVSSIIEYNLPYNIRKIGNQSDIITSIYYGSINLSYLSLAYSKWVDNIYNSYDDITKCHIVYMSSVVSKYYYTNASYISSYAFAGYGIISGVNFKSVINIMENAFYSTTMFNCAFPKLTTISEYAFDGANIENCFFPKLQNIPSNGFPFGFQYQGECVVLPEVKSIGTNGIGSANGICLPKATYLDPNAIRLAPRNPTLWGPAYIILGSSFCSVIDTPISCPNQNESANRIYVPMSLYDSYRYHHIWKQYSGKSYIDFYSY